MPPAKGSMREPFIMEYEAEELSSAQLAYNRKIDEQLDAYKKKIEELSKSKDISIQENGGITVIEFSGLPGVIPFQQPAMVPTQLQAGSNQNLVFQPNSNIVVVDKSLGLVMNTVANTISSPTIANTNIRFQPPTPTTIYNRGGHQPRFRGRTGRGTAIRQANILKKTVNTLPVFSTATVRGGFTGIKVDSQLKTALEYGGIARTSTSSRSGSGKDEVVVDLTDEDLDDSPDPAASKCDTKEVAINKNSEKTFPSLVVLARPFLGPKEFSNSQVQQRRAALDEKVKQVLSLSAPQFTEWLLQQGLLRSEQTCTAAGKTKSHKPLKLGMYSDSSKFPYSGGYVWISECCTSQFVSVFAGSIFEATPHTPHVILKLIYHWSCQTNMQYVIQWVKVDNLYVKTLYTNLRAICTAAIHQRFPKFGGIGKRVQIGVISLGTTTHDGSSRQVKVEVLGMLDESTKMLRIRAIDPVVIDQTLDQHQQMKKRFQKTLDLVPKWVHPNSDIVIDQTVDMATLIEMGFPKVIQVAQGETNHGYKIMEYLKKIIPRMFQNTLSLLSRQIIQQFLDELVWREAFGPIPGYAFDKILEHISEQTRLNTGGTLLNRLSRINLNPFKDWQYDKWSANCKAPGITPIKTITQKQIPMNRKFISSPAASTTAASLASQSASSYVEKLTSSKKSDYSSTDPAMIALEPYYYGVLEGDISKKKYVPFFTQCYVCRTDFKNVLKLTDHLILHALNKNLESVSDPKDICRICLKIRLPGSKQHHLQMCQPGPLNPGCRICAMKLKDKGSLVYHMTKTHHQLDMPYLCGKCGFRVSELDQLNNHFVKVHHNGASGMCPFCLKVVDFATPGGDDLEHNQIFFIKHIQRHVLPSSKKCNRCLLNFVNKSILAAHEVQMHASLADNDDVMRFLVDDPTLMPAPIMEPSLVHVLQPGDLKPTGLLKGISNVTLGILTNVEEGLPIFCHECESPVSSEHFVNYLMCNKCSFRTCCSHAMVEHVSLIHPPYPLSSPVYVGMKATISQKAFCSSCSYSTRDGNLMCNHLVTCGGSCTIGKRRAVFKESDAVSIEPRGRKRRTRKTRASYFEDSDEELRSNPRPRYSHPKSVLNVLGLIRKSTDEEGSQGPPESEANSEAEDDPEPLLCEVSMFEGSENVIDSVADVVPTGSTSPGPSSTLAETENMDVDSD